MKQIIILLATIALVSSARLEYFKISYPPETGRAKLNFVDNVWLQLNQGSSWKTWRFDMNLLIDSRESYQKVVSELPSISEYFNCNMVGNVQLRCIFWGSEIVQQLAREEGTNYVFYSFEIKNPNGGSNASLDFKVVENVNEIEGIIDAIVAETDPENSKAFLR